MLNGGGGHGDWTPHPVKPPSRHPETRVRAVGRWFPRSAGGEKWVLCHRIPAAEANTVHGEQSLVHDVVRTLPFLIFCVSDGSCLQVRKPFDPDISRFSHSEESFSFMVTVVLGSGLQGHLLNVMVLGVGLVKARLF